VRIAVIGGGTAGYLAAAHLSRFFPEADLLHIFDSSIAPIGVGEGTLPTFKRWLDAVTGAPFSRLAEACQATIKEGVRFEGWGTTNSSFHHRFAGNRHAYHLSAAHLPAFLSPHIHATHLDKHVSHLESSGRRVEIRFGDDTHLTADLVFDATGFPREMGPGQTMLHDIPTNAALVCRGPATPDQAETRAVARPHGWIFVIPLTTSTSYGYIYHADISQQDEVQADFAQFLAEEGIAMPDSFRLLRFPSFVQQQLFDGALFRIGNAASFLEPLEATAIGITLEQLRVAGLWLGGGLPGAAGSQRWSPELLGVVNEHLSRTVQAVALFVSWHYAHGSAYDTPFWHFARANYAERVAGYAGTELLAEFSRFVEAGARFPAELLDDISDREAYEQEIKPRMMLDDELGGFGLVSFAQVGHGIGAYADMGLETGEQR
jgi:tryptophan halogenase